MVNMEIETKTRVLDMWLYCFSRPEEPARLNRSEVEEHSSSRGEALAYLVDTAVHECSVAGWEDDRGSETELDVSAECSITLDMHNLALIVQGKGEAPSSAEFAERQASSKFIIPLLGADIKYSRLRAGNKTHSQLPQCILGLAPRRSVSRLGHGGAWGSFKQQSEKIDEVWLFCVGCGVDLHNLLGELGRAGAIRWDFEEAYELESETPHSLRVGGVNYYLAQVPERGRQPRAVAVKGAQDAQRSFLWETAILARFQWHPNVVWFHGAFAQWEQGTTLDAKLTFQVHAGTLDSVIQARGSFSQARSYKIMAGLTSALSCLHDQRLVHRSVETSAVLVGSAGEAVLTCFDTVACIDDISAMGSFVGAPGFTAPEIIKNQAYGVRADCFSAGVIFYCIVSAEYPFGYYTGRHLECIDKSTRRCKPNFEKQEFACLPASLFFLMRSMLSKSPKARPCARHACNCFHAWLPAELMRKYETQTDSQECMGLCSAREESVKSVLEVQDSLPSLPRLSEMPPAMERPSLSEEPPMESLPPKEPANRSQATSHTLASPSGAATRAAQDDQRPTPKSMPTAAGPRILRSILDAVRDATASLAVSLRAQGWMHRRSPSAAAEDNFVAPVPAAPVEPAPQGGRGSMFRSHRRARVQPVRLQ